MLAMIEPDNYYCDQLNKTAFGCPYPDTPHPSPARLGAASRVPY